LIEILSPSSIVTLLAKVRADLKRMGFDIVVISYETYARTVTFLTEKRVPSNTYFSNHDTGIVSGLNF